MQKFNQPTSCQLYLVRKIKGELPTEAPRNLFEGSGAPEAKIMPAKIQENPVLNKLSNVADEITAVTGLM